MNPGLLIAALLFICVLAVFAAWLANRQEAQTGEIKREVKRLRKQVTSTNQLITRLEEIAVDSRTADPSFDLILAEIRNHRKEIEPQ